MKNGRIKAPRIAQWILYRISDPTERNSIMGDFNEIYEEKAYKTGKLHALFWYWGHLLGSLPHFFKTLLCFSGAMFKNFLKVTIRNLKRKKLYPLINIFGLAVGLACFILSYLYVKHEFSYDKYHNDSDRIYRIAIDIQRDSPKKSARIPPPLIPVIREKYPEVENAVRFHSLNWRRNIVQYENKIFEERRIILAEPEIFKIFKIPFIQGNPDEALLRPGTMVVTEKTSEKYFGVTNPIGKNITAYGRSFEITGIVENPPDNTHFKYDFIASLQNSTNPESLSNWGWTGFYSYIKLNSNNDYRGFENKIRFIADNYIGEELKEWSERYIFYLQPVTSIHLNSNITMELEPPGNKMTAYLSLIIGSIILLIACFNFINLSVAQGITRIKEVGMRKVTGAGRLHIILQCLGETFIITLISVLISLIILYFTLPFFNKISGQNFQIGILLNINMIIFLLFLSVLVGLFSGFYPSFYLSRIKPANVFTDRFSLGSKKTFLRRVLVICQFVVSVVFMIGTFLVYKQTYFLKDSDVGFDKENKLVLAANIGTNIETIKNEFLSHPSITDASISWSVPGRIVDSYTTRLTSGEVQKSESMNYYFIDHDFISLYGLKIIAGRDFSREIISDARSSFILNEAAVRAFDISSPEEAIGKRIYEGGQGTTGNIIGVVKDFHYKGLQSIIEPLVLQIRPEQFNTISLSIKPDNPDKTLTFVENKWKELQLGQIFEYFFLADVYKSFYGSEELSGNIFLVFSVLAVFVACIGLFGLSSNSSERRIKEIGIRKALGASVNGIVNLLLREFLLLVLISNIIAWPVSYFLMSRWLNNFPVRTDIKIWIFLISAVITLIIALVTVIYQSVKAALSDPVECLRYE